MKIASIWTIYKHPKDYPESFVARQFLLDKATDNILIAPTLAGIRQAIQNIADYELIRIERAECDDSVIVESWL